MYLAAMLRDVVRRRRWAHAPVIHAASHVDHEKRVARVPISMHTCGPFSISMDAPLGGPSGRWSSAIKTLYNHSGPTGSKACHYNSALVTIFLILVRYLICN